MQPLIYTLKKLDDEFIFQSLPPEISDLLAMAKAEVDEAHKVLEKVDSNKKSRARNFYLILRSGKYLERLRVRLVIHSEAPRPGD